VGLTGELRYVAHADRRVGEATKFGLTDVLGPKPAEGRVKNLSTQETIAEAIKSAGAKRRLEEVA
jgi:predicted ATP-dependent serine protease